MAVATTTAIALGSLALSAGTTGMSFAQAGKQRQAQRQAEKDAEQAMVEARKKLEVNFYENLGIQKEPYELEREALLSQGAQAIQAGVESERGAAATAGRIQMAQQQGQAGIRTAMGQDLMNLQKLAASEEARLAGLGYNLDLEEVAGAQKAARDAQQLEAQATQQAMQGIQSIAQQGLSTFVPLFSKQSTDALGNPISVRPDRFALPEAANSFQNSSSFVTDPFNFLNSGGTSLLYNSNK
jgi:hypothetical protein